MKIGILVLLTIITVNVNAQSLKDALYGGKLKTDSGSVLRKGDDLSSKIDTSTKKDSAAEKNKPGIVKTDASKINKMATADSSMADPAEKTDNNTLLKDNNKIWKDFVDEVTVTLKEEVLNSKKIKKADYYVTLDYTIGLEGEVSINNVYVTPENKTIEQQVKERFSIDTPRLNPVLSSNGKPRKAVKRTNFTLTKD